MSSLYRRSGNPSNRTNVKLMIVKLKDYKVKLEDNSEK